MVFVSKAWQDAWKISSLSRPPLLPLFLVLGVEPRTLGMAGKHSPIEPHPQQCEYFLVEHEELDVWNLMYLEEHLGHGMEFSPGLLISLK
jgi:hypothetical protein